MKNYVSQEEDRSTKQEQYDEKSVILRRELLEGRLSVTTEDERVEQLHLKLRRE